MAKDLSTVDLFKQAGMGLPGPADFPALRKALEAKDCVTISYQADTPVSTNAMLSIGHRLLVENYDLQRVTLVRVGVNEAVTVRINLNKTANNNIEEDFSVGQIAS